MPLQGAGPDRGEQYDLVICHAVNLEWLADPASRLQTLHQLCNPEMAPSRGVLINLRCRWLSEI